MRMMRGYFQHGVHRCARIIPCSYRFLVARDATFTLPATLLAMLGKGTSRSLNMFAEGNEGSDAVTS